MKKEAICIMLIDDDKNDNFFHEREIKKASFESIVIVEESGIKALDYLKTMSKKNNIKPILIFLDINMPGMDGWEFLDEYSRLDKDIQTDIKVVILTTSDNPATKARAMTWHYVSDYITKPLTKVLIENINDKYFKYLLN